MRRYVSLFYWLPLFAVSSGFADELPRNTESVKNLILLIGDGMGPQQMGLLTTYARQAPNSLYAAR